VQGEVDVDGSGVGIGIYQRVATLMRLAAIREPAPHPHGRVHRPFGQQPAGVEVQPQIVRADLGAPVTVSS
jgi:hypothetical protein